MATYLMWIGFALGVLGLAVALIFRGNGRRVGVCAVVIAIMLLLYVVYHRGLVHVSFGNESPTISLTSSQPAASPALKACSSTDIVPQPVQVTVNCGCQNNCQQSQAAPPPQPPPVVKAPPPKKKPHRQVAHPRPAPKVATPAPDSGQCYIVPLDYRATEYVLWSASQSARVSVHIDMTEGEKEEVFSDPCFFVHDANGSRKPFPRCDECDIGIWPEPTLAGLVKLPSEPIGRFAFNLANGVGYISYPRSMKIARTAVYCVDTDKYYMSVPGYGGRVAVTRFNVVWADEVQATLPSGKLGRTLHGESHY